MKFTMKKKNFINSKLGRAERSFLFGLGGFALLMLAISLMGGRALAASSDKVRKESSEAATALVRYASESKEEFKKDAKIELEKLQKKMDELEIQASDASGKMKKELDAQLKKLAQRRVEIEKELDKAAKSSARAWEKMRPNLERAMSELMTAINQAKNEFQKEEAVEKKKNPSSQTDW